MSRVGAPKPRALKTDLFKWVEDQQQLDMRTKYILEKLASLADAQACAWSPVPWLAYAANCSDRTVQYHLRALEEAGLIRATGEMHRLDNSTRSVPVYQLAPKVEGLGLPMSMGAKIAPIDEGHGCNSDGGMGAIGLHPQEPKEPSSGDKSPSPGAREIEEAFEALEAATPRAVLKFSDRDAALAAFAHLADRGVEVAQLAGCARRMAADPVFKSRKFPPPLEIWIAKGQWRGWIEEGSPDGAAVAVAPTCQAPADLRAAVVTAKGEDFARAALDPCAFVAGPPARLIPRTGWAETQLRQVRGLLANFQVIVEREAS